MSEQKKKENTKTTNKSTKKTTPVVSTEKAGSQSVRGKVLSYHLAAAEMVQSGILALQAGMRDMQSAIGKQKKKNAEGAVAIQSGVDEMVSNIAAMRVAIAEHAQDNQDYIKQFIG
jgi:hypothetical protein